MDRKEEWKLPDGSQLSYMALQEMGLTSGDVGEVMRQMYRDPDPEAMRNMALKGGALLGGRAEDKNDADFQQKMQENDERVNKEHFEEGQRMAAQHREQEQQDQLSYEEKQRLDREMMEKRQMDEQANRNIMGGMAGLFGFGAVLGLAPTALNAAGQAMSGSVNAVNSPMMVASNNGGGLLAGLRGVLGIGGPGNDKDIQLTGPNRTNVFTPGVTPEIAMSTPSFNPNSPNPFSQKPGMGMPGLTPPGMG